MLCLVHQAFNHYSRPPFSSLEAGWRAALSGATKNLRAAVRLGPGNTAPTQAPKSPSSRLQMLFLYYQTLKKHIRTPTV
jgi:hypothetical protein